MTNKTTEKTQRNKGSKPVECIFFYGDNTHKHRPKPHKMSSLFTNSNDLRQRNQFVCVEVSLSLSRFCNNIISESFPSTGEKCILHN